MVDQLKESAKAIGVPVPKEWDPSTVCSFGSSGLPADSSACQGLATILDGVNMDEDCSQLTTELSDWGSSEGGFSLTCVPIAAPEVASQKSEEVQLDCPSFTDIDLCGKCSCLSPAKNVTMSRSDFDARKCKKEGVVAVPMW